MCENSLAGSGLIAGSDSAFWSHLPRAVSMGMAHPPSDWRIERSHRNPRAMRRSLL